MKRLYPHAIPQLLFTKLHTRLLILLTAFSFTASAQNLDFSNYTLQSGTNLSVGAVYRFSNVTSTGTVDALVTVTTLYNLQLKSIDSAYTGTAPGFQPMVSSINGKGDHYALFHIDFVQAGTSTPVNMVNFDGTFFDLNGSNQINEYASIDMANDSWHYANGTPGVSVTQTGNLIQGTSTNSSLSQSIDTANQSNSFVVTSSFASSFDVKFGFNQTSNGWSGNDQFSLLFHGSAPATSSLPVMLINWNAAYINSNIALKWTTTSERNASHFIIERSFDGSDYSDIAMLFAAGNSDISVNYSYNDKVPAGNSGIIYYRLKMVDMDGRYTTSDIRIVRIGKSEEGLKILAYPNPVVNDVRVTIPQNWQGKNISYRLTNASGQLIKSYSVQYASQTEVIAMSHVPAGMYIMSVTNGSETAVQSVVKSGK